MKLRQRIITIGMAAMMLGGTVTTASILPNTVITSVVSAAETGQLYTITASDWLALRSGDSTNYTLLAKIPKGTIVSVTKYNSNKSWGYTTYDGKSGWICLQAFAKPYDPVSISNNTYFIIPSTNLNQSICVEKMSKNDKANVFVYKHYSIYDNRYWKIEKYNGQWYRIINVRSGKVLDVSGGSNKNGTNVQQYTWNGSASQLWRFYSAGNGYYYIQNKLGTYLNVAGGKTSDETNIQTCEYNGNISQKFKLNVANNDVSNNTYFIIPSTNLNQSICVEKMSKNDKANVFVYKHYSIYDNRYWKIEKYNGQWYRIINVRSGKVLDVSGGSNKNGTNVQQYTWNGSASQLWRFFSAGNGYYYIQSKLGTYLNVAGGKTSDETNIQTWEYNGTSSQRFKLTVASTPAQTKTIPLDVYLMQSRDSNCTSTACTILLRAKAAISGKSYKNITISNVESKCWIKDQGCKSTFCYGGYTVKQASLKGTTKAQKEAELKKILKSHPEGVVIYTRGINKPHAVYLSPDFKVLDPGKSMSKKWYTIAQINNTNARNLNKINSYWYIQ